MRELSISESLRVGAANGEVATNHHEFEYQQQFVGVLFGAAIMTVGGGLAGYYVASGVSWLGVKVATTFIGAYSGYLVGRVVGPNLFLCP